MKKLVFLFAILAIATVFTSCGKEEDPPAPLPVATPTAVTSGANNHVMGSGWNIIGPNDANISLKLFDSNMNEVFNGTIYSPSSQSSYITLNFNETYTYQLLHVNASPQVTYTGAYSVNASGLTHSNASPVVIHYANSTLTFWKP